MKRIRLREKPKVVDITKKSGTVETLTEARINCTVDEKVIIIPSQQSWRGYSNAAVRGWLGE